jgi:hypothetical protein
MNTPIFSNELEPAEQRRRASAIKRAEKLCRRLGFREVAARPGWWYHEGCDPEMTFQLTHPSGPVQTTEDVFCMVFFTAHQAGIEKARAQLKKALGL